MLTKELNYHLPSELIAQKPCTPRDHSRLLILDRKKKTITHDHFYNIGKYLQPTDLLVANQSKVIPARLYGHKEKTKGKVEILLLRKTSTYQWEAIARPLKRLSQGTIINFKLGISAEITQKHSNNTITLKFNKSSKKLISLLDKIGHTPLPPYIKTRKEFRQEYQTLYASNQKPGSAAAPTAGLHFTPKLINNLKKRGIDFSFLTLHVGLGTFAPVKTTKVEDHPIHSEYYEITSSAWKKIQNHKGRVVAVGTTTVRTLETIAKTKKLSGETSLFIKPGFKFKTTDALITNFHLPESSLLSLIYAFSSKALTKKAYREAIKEKYRFYSFGDAMLIL